MEPVQGPQLEALVHVRARLLEQEACVYAAQVLEALSYLHAHRIVHRDLKLANLLLTPDRKRVMLCDFGLAAHLDTLKQGGGGGVCGTPNYVAPELIAKDAIARGKRRGARGAAHAAVYTTGADVWSMGVVLYTMLVGSGPFDGEDVPKTFRRIRTARFTFPVGLKLSANAKHLIRLLLTEDVSKRPSADQALRHPFFSSCEMPRPTPGERGRLACENGSLGGGNDGGGKGARGDRVDEKFGFEGVKRNGKLAAGHRRTVDSRRLSAGAHQQPSWLRQEASQSLVMGNGAEHSIALERQARVERDRERPSSIRSDRAGAPIVSRERMLSRASKERSLSMNTPESRGKGGGGSRRSSLNARALEGVRGGRWSGMTGSGRRLSMLSAERRDEVLNLSVSVSAGLLRGRKYFDEWKLGKENGGRRPMRTEEIARRVDGTRDAPPLVRRWLDYTSKYGFATMMEDGRTGCCFNDGTIMVLLSEKDGIPNFAYIGAKGVGQGEEEEDGKRPNDISKKACLCTLFADMMADGGRGSMYDLPSACNVSFLKPDEQALEQSGEQGYEEKSEHQVVRETGGEDCKEVVHVREWVRFRNQQAAAFRLSNHSIHVKFDVGDDGCDDFVFDVGSGGNVFYRAARAEDGFMFGIRNLGEFSGKSERLLKQLEICSQAISRFLE